MNIILIVGASGAGKDTLLRHAVKHFADNDTITFTRRYITRPADINEDNYFIDPLAFTILENMHFFMSAWQAHGNHYGIAKHSVQQCCSGSTVVCSVSRSVIGDFELCCENVSTILVSVKEEILRQRLIGRGREKKEKIEERLLRANTPVLASNLLNFDNSGDLQGSIDAFNALVQKLSRRKTYAF